MQETPSKRDIRRTIDNIVIRLQEGRTYIKINLMKFSDEPRPRALDLSDFTEPFKLYAKRLISDFP